MQSCVFGRLRSDGREPNCAEHSQVQDQGEGMNDAQIRHKVKRAADQTGKLNGRMYRALPTLKKKFGFCANIALYLSI